MVTRRPSIVPPRRRRTRCRCLSLCAFAALASLVGAIPHASGAAAGAPRVAAGAQQPRPWPPEPSAGQAQYVALGDSFASGEGAPDPAFSEVEDGRWQLGTNQETRPKNLCHRSVYAYSVDVAAAAGLPLSFHACSGANAADLTRGNHEFPGEPVPQLDWLNADARLVTLTLGGNDVGFAPLARKCAQSNCEKLLAKDNAKLNDEQATLVRAYEQIHERAPLARILVVGYPRLLPEHPSTRGCRIAGLPLKTLSFTEMDGLNQFVARLNRVIARSVFAVDPRPGDASPGSLEMVDVTDALVGHELCTRHRWVNGFVGLPEVSRRQSFHPTRDGQHALGAAVIACYHDRSRCAGPPDSPEEADLKSSFEFNLRAADIQCDVFSNGAYAAQAAICSNRIGHDIVEIFDLHRRAARLKWRPPTRWSPPGRNSKTVSLGMRRLFLFAGDSYLCRTGVYRLRRLDRPARGVRCESLISRHGFKITETRATVD